MKTIKELIRKLRTVRGLPLLCAGLAVGLIFLYLGSLGDGSGVKKETNDDDFRAVTEERICGLLETMNGISDVRVMLSVGTEGEVDGIAVVCRGGGEAANQCEIIGLLCSLYGLPSTRVCVTAAG